MVSLDEFVDSSFQPHHQALTASENEAVSASCVVASVDAAIRFNDSLFVTAEGSKMAVPHALMNPGETFAQACQRLIDDQLGIRLDDRDANCETRCTLKGVMNHGLPGGNQVHRIGQHISITLTEAEAQQIPAGAWAKVKNIVNCPLPVYQPATTRIALEEKQEIFDQLHPMRAEYECTRSASTPPRLSDEDYTKILDSRVLR